ncbi:MAG: outer membrane lipoprotein-sorting protein [Gemmatimonadaceae bacterium]|nr:outer membrane lipoprotein-sorting protein [Gemmatimonadaceae bacterium]
MNTKITTAAGGLALLATMSVVTSAQEPPTQIMVRSQEAFLAAGNDMVARITMKLINKAGKERLRDLTMLRRDLEIGNQKYFMYFHQPADVRAMTFMVWKYPGRDDDRWVFVPAIKLVRRIAADDSRSSFVGSDFTYDDISGRDIELDRHTLLKEEAVGGTPCYVIESVPTSGSASEYGRKLSWIAKDSWLPLKEEYYDRRAQLARVFTADEVQTIGGHPTVMRRTMRDVKRAHRTEVAFESVRYDVGLTEALFAERYLREPPAEWIR